MMNKTEQYNYDQNTDEFVLNVTGKESGDITGNRVFVSYEMDTPRFKVEIDDFGNVIAAFNRLIKKFIPTFVFPCSQSEDDEFIENIKKLSAELKFSSDFIGRVVRNHFKNY